MNDGRQMEVQYVDTGFPYTVSESFMDFFQCLTTHLPVNYAHAGSVLDQESIYWSMNMNPYKFGLSGPVTTCYYGSYEINDHFPRFEMDRSEWEYPSTIVVDEPTPTESSSGRDGVTSMQTIPEECSPNHQESSSSQVMWQDNIDPDNMTYEELLDLGEAVGTHNRGLSQELIDTLPTSKYNFGSLFKRKNSAKRCVICQMSYRRGDQQIKLPCNHVYHSECITRWLNISKKCPVCNIEVFGEDSSN
ncbi:E3 ubiquitin ligase BIG BROTHER [Vigna radiata var. radiata]|uniref:E3 ubiquitin ligase BIG BROTHER n=1 Tax=Vigna radiata var. radiata TaxID=3916 RepID=A0A1S3U3H5_VIGRR|nr:E3 ubiquitin ligase BIG BROTHER [Vigna radiata var. radiata]